MRLIKCDRCNEVLDKPRYAYSLHFQRRGHSREPIKGKDIDLCKECYEDALDYVNKPREAQQEGAAST